MAGNISGTNGDIDKW